MQAIIERLRYATLAGSIIYNVNWRGVRLFGHDIVRKEMTALRV